MVSQEQTIVEIIPILDVTHRVAVGYLVATTMLSLGAVLTAAIIHLVQS